MLAVLTGAGLLIIVIVWFVTYLSNPVVTIKCRVIDKPTESIGGMGMSFVSMHIVVISEYDSELGLIVDNKFLFYKVGVGDEILIKYRGRYLKEILKKY